MLYIFTSILWANPEIDTISAALAQYNEYAYFTLPSLTRSQIDKLLDGETLSIIDQPGPDIHPRRAVGIRLSELPKEKLWIACQDKHFLQQSSTKELRVDFHPPDAATWYGYFDVPWPFSDRHWYVKSWNNHILAKQTNNNAWEHPWELIPDGKALVRPHIAQGKLPGITEEMMDTAIYTPINIGAWATIDVNDRSLLVYHATTQVGGNIPEDLMVRFVKSGLDEMLREMEYRAHHVIESHYSEKHPLLPGGDGELVPHFK